MTNPTGKNIWYVSKYACPLKYGFAHRHFYFANEFNKTGNNTTVIGSDSNHLATFPKFSKMFTRESIDGVDTVWVKTLKYSGTGGIKRILSWIDFEVKLFFLRKKELPRPDVTIVSSLSLITILTGIRWKRKYKCRLVFEVRDIWPLTIIEIGGYKRYNPFVAILAWIERRGYKKSDYIIGTIKTLEEKYGIDQLLEAFSIFKKKYEGETIKLMIVGDGTLKQKLEQKSFELGLGKTCEFLGKVNYDQVPFYHQQLDVCVCLSNSESFGVSAIEASALKRPVIVSDVGGLPEVVENNVTGIVVPPKDPKRAAEAIEKLFLDKSMREEMGEQGRKRVEKLYDWDKNLLDMLNIYNKVLENKAV